MILLCGECKKWQAEAKRIDTHKYGYCPLKRVRTKRVHICDMMEDKSTIEENKTDPASNEERQKRKAAREFEAVALYEKGFTPPEIAKRMQIAQRTVNGYISSYNKKQQEALGNV